MKLKDFKNPESERLILRHTNMDDIALIFALRSSPIVRKYIMQSLFTEQAEAVAHINKLISYLNEDVSIAWTLVDKNTNKKLGGICLWNFSEDRKTAEVGYDLLPKHFKKGYMSEALQAVIKFGFNNLKLKAIEAFTHVDNEASKKLLENNGFVLQPNRKDPDFPKNRIYTLHQ